MADDTKQTGGGTVTGDGMVVDANKTAKQYMDDASKKYIVPALVRDKFPDLVKLIYETESMNEEERQYWLQIMPIMTEDQIMKFREILVNEKDQLSKLDNEYDAEMARINKPVKKLDEAQLHEKIQEVKTAEIAAEKSELEKEAELLKQLDSF
ncbi:hypothetical protein JKY72_04160 [Candidatus Gracilibacteria bacterium]|nr:hypothetical protein [Candidatus Gracilibacteria bacterium]